MLRCAPATAALALATSLLTLYFPFFPVHPLLGLQNTIETHSKHYWWRGRFGHGFQRVAKQEKYLRG